MDSQGGGGSCLCLCARALLPSVCLTLSWFRLSHDHDPEFVSSQNASEDTTDLGGWMSLPGPPDQGFGACKPLPAGADPKTACAASAVKPVQCPAVRSLITQALSLAWKHKRHSCRHFSFHGRSFRAMVLSSFVRRKFTAWSFRCHVSVPDKRLRWLGVGCMCQVGLIIQCVTLLQGNISRQQCSGTPRPPTTAHFPLAE